MLQYKYSAKISKLLWKWLYLRLRKNFFIADATFLHFFASYTIDNTMSIGKEKDLSLEVLAQRSLQNDPIAQRLLYDSLAGKMLALCKRYVGDRETARDVMHDGFIRLFEKLENYSGVGSFEGWARKIFVNMALSYLRKSDVLRFSEPVDGVKSPVSLPFLELDTFSTHDLLTYIAAMPPGFRAVFNLFAVEGYSHDEIAQILRISEGTSRSQYLRAREWLQKKLKHKKTI